MIYSKLVRDGVPASIEQSGKNAITSVLGDEQYLNELTAKMIEEMNELIESRSLEEAANLKEVFYALCDHLGLARIEVEQARQAKAKALGGFGARLYLESVE